MYADDINSSFVRIISIFMCLYGSAFSWWLGVDLNLIHVKCQLISLKYEFPHNLLKSTAEVAPTRGSVYLVFLRSSWMAPLHETFFLLGVLMLFSPTSL